MIKRMRSALIRDANKHDMEWFPPRWAELVWMIFGRTP